MPALGRRFAAGGAEHAVWVDETGGVTVGIGPEAAGTEFVTVVDAGTGDFAGERSAGRRAGVFPTRGRGAESSRDGVEPDPERIDFHPRPWQADDATSR
ncbi:hypothetical protein A5692_19730 [Mycobacterium sp. E342]|uniref:hypothetical protein n=1 Tax=Mycobacterium sp. E342 TaxID=1834147 RepID=UPI0007FF3F82|nr:hypothetical protein [Mycobacterium sp. E342]OBH30107.1 hypothetical protein A5692_19730 [Mycobacterium sp. E342]